MCQLQTDSSGGNNNVICSKNSEADKDCVELTGLRKTDMILQLHNYNCHDTHVGYTSVDL